MTSPELAASLQFQQELTRWRESCMQEAVACLVEVAQSSLFLEPQQEEEHFLFPV
jgi:hypothetical protein